MVGDVLVLAGIVGIMLWMNPRLSLVTFTVLPCLVWIAFTFRRRMREAFRAVRARLADLNAFLAESIGGMGVIQLFNRQRTEQEEFTRLNTAYRDANLPVITWDASLYAMVEALSSVATGLRGDRGSPRGASHHIQNVRLVGEVLPKEVVKQHRAQI